MPKPPSVLLSTPFSTLQNSISAATMFTHL
jgi:hypothetical protein